MKYIFTFTTGRTGTAYLAEMLGQNLPNCFAVHERNRFGDYGVHTPDISHLHEFNCNGNTEYIKQFWKRKIENMPKLPEQEYHVETSHILTKAGLMENLDMLDGEVHIIIAERDFMDLMQSFHSRLDLLDIGNMWLWYLDPEYTRNLINFGPYEHVPGFGHRAWYIKETFARAEKYEKEGKAIFHHINTKNLSDEDTLKKLLKDISGEEPEEVHIPPPANVNPDQIPHTEEEIELIKTLL